MRALIAIAFVALMGAGEAAAATCSALRAQLAAAQSGGGSAQLRAQFNAYGCGASSAWGRHRACAGIERRMNGGGGSSRQVRALQSQVAAACASETRAASSRDVGRNVGGRVVAGGTNDNRVDERGRGNFFTNLFRGGRRNDDGAVRSASVAPRASVGTVERLDMDEARGRRKTRTTDDGGKPASGGDVSIAAVASESGGKKLREGSTQTVCVRLCDGFYFPINDRSHSANFYEELAMCVGRCPGADVSLYSHGSGSSVEGMRSTLTNEPYTSLPTAFDYRKGLNDGCGCQTKSLVAGDQSSDQTLAYVGLSGSGAGATVTDGATDPARAWTRLKAVFDETGKPLPPSLTDRTVVDGTLRAGSMSAADEARVAAVVPAAAARTPAPTLPMTGSAPLRVREVGGQFFSESTSAEARARRHSPSQVVTTTAVRVVPLSPDAILGAAPLTDEFAGMEPETDAFVGLGAAEPDLTDTTAIELSSDG